MQHDRIGTLTRARRLAARWPEYFLVVLDGDVPVARAVSVPVAFPTPERTEKPDHGWDGVILRAVQDALDNRPTTTLVTACAPAPVTTGWVGRWHRYAPPARSGAPN
ncbi:hypothetical protein [Streptosporangium brasiliense]|uniref:hypothetical protein n=1 Tax=Streptosporangium brasiliense TaxID=47480 RepID=UPI0027D8CE5A|nr:hypothetical protein [Streptosporangium brasiliense]